MNIKKTLFYSIFAMIFSTLTFSSSSFAQDFDTQTLFLASGDHDTPLGTKNSRVTIIEYGDYQCPYCARFSTSVEPQIRSEYINSGKVRMIYRNLQFTGSEALTAAAAAACANDQGKFWAYHDALYHAKMADYNNGGSENDGFYNRALFMKLGQQVNLNMSSFGSCIDSKKYYAQVKQDTDSASAMGINRTPMVYINNEAVANPNSYEVVKAIIEKKLNK